MMNLAPALIGIPKRSRNNPSAIDGAINAACASAMGIDVPMPVLHDGRVVAAVRGYTGKAFVDVYWADPLWCAFNNYGDITDALRANRTYIARWQKNATTSATANNWYDFWPVGGDPVSGTYPGAALTSVQWGEDSTGAIRHGGNVSSSLKYLIRSECSASANTTPTVIIYDRVLTYEACAISNVNQVFVNSLAAQRYIGTGEPGLKIMVTNQTALGATANAYTQLQYTDQNGNTLQSMPTTAPVNVIVSTGAPSATNGARVVSPAVAAGTVAIGPFMALAAGDTGVRLLDNVTSSASNTGTLAYVLCFPLAVLPITNLTNPAISIADQVMQLTSLAIVKDGACLAPLVHFPAATGATYSGRIDTAWG